MTMASVANADLSGLFQATESTQATESGNNRSQEDAEADKVEETESEVEETKNEESSEEGQSEEEKVEKGESTEEDSKDESKDDEKEKDKDSEKKEPKKTEAQKIASQQRALSRRETRLNKEQSAFNETVNKVTKHFEEKKAKYDALEKLDELDEFGVIQVLAERKGKSAVEMIRNLITVVATGKSPTDSLESKAEDKVEAEKKPDPALLEMKKTLEAMKAKLDEKEVKEREAEDAAYLDNYLERAEDAITEEAFPFLATYPAEVRQRMILETANEAAKKANYVATPEEVIQYLEEKMEERARALSTPLQKKLARTKVTSVEKSTTPVTGASSGTTKTKSESPKVFTNKDSGERGNDFTSQRMTDRQRIDDAAKVLERLAK